MIVTRSRHYAGPYVVAPDAALSEPLLHVCLFERWGRSHTLRFGLALLRGRLPRTAGYRVVAGRDVRVSVLSDAGEAGRQPVQIDGDDALTLAGVDRPRRRRGAPAAAGLRLLGPRASRPAHDACSGPGWPRGPARGYRAACCRRRTTSGVGWPSAGRPACFWNSRTAERVLGPSSPSVSSV